MAEEKGRKPHVLIFPMPIQGHMPPMLKLAQLLLPSTTAGASDFLVTFVNTEHSHRRFALHSPSFDILDRHPNFRFRTIPDGLPVDDPRQPLQFMQLMESLRTQSREPYRKLLAPSNGWPQVNCVVADAILAVAIEVAEEQQIPVMVFRTSSACSFWVFRCVRNLIHRGDIPFPDNADLDEMVQGVEGMEGILRRRDLPSFCRDSKSPDDPRLQIMTTITDNASRGRALIMNTFQSLEAPSLSLIRSFCPIIYTIGPLYLLARTILGSSDATASDHKQKTASLWREDRECMTWLDSQPPKSVVYVSFGSIVAMSREEQLELWHALVDSGHRFLWVVRKDLVMNTGDHEMAPPEVEEGTRERGCLVSWAPQKEVLAHRAIGCFFTHSGWNSTMESIAAGVPMICWPFITDQQVNSRFVTQAWKIGLGLSKNKLSRRAFEQTIRDAMEGNKAEELRRSASEMAEKAKRSAEEGGDSYLNFQMLVQHIKSLAQF